MLFMDHLSADLLSKNLPGEQKEIQAINISLNNNRVTNLTMYTQSCVRVSPSRHKRLNNYQIKLLQVVNYKLYSFIKVFKLSS